MTPLPVPEPLTEAELAEAEAIIRVLREPPTVPLRLLAPHGWWPDAERGAPDPRVVADEHVPARHVGLAVLLGMVGWLLLAWVAAMVWMGVSYW